MFAKTVSLYKNAYSGLSASTWWLSMIMLVNRSGTMVVPFMSIYMTTPVMGYSIGEAGIVMGLFGLGAVAGGFFGGRITDKAGFYPVQVCTLIGGGILFIVLGQMKSYPLICLFSFLLSLVNEAFRPANATAVAAYSKENNRTRSYALNRLAINLGWAVGGAVGGYIASHSYILLFWVDGLTNIVAALLLLYFLPPSSNYVKPVAIKQKPVGSLSAHKDKFYLIFILLTILFATCFFQMFSTLTVYFKKDLSFSESYIGFLMAVNGLVITFIEMILVFKLEGKRKNTFYIFCGVLLCGISYLMLNFFTITHLLAVCMILLITFGEILSMPFMNAFWISRSADHNRGQYAGLYTIAWATAQTCGPLFGSLIADRSGFPLLWWLVGALCVLTAFGFFLLHKYSR
ncbi:MAG: MFS transporter [Chitinophagaceae bacterium]|nr:MFS transporter [Chitinophagaceae bacterium]